MCSYHIGILPGRAVSRKAAWLTTPQGPLRAEGRSALIQDTVKQCSDRTESSVMMRASRRKGTMTVPREIKGR